MAYHNISWGILDRLIRSGRIGVPSALERGAHAGRVADRQVYSDVTAKWWRENRSKSPAGFANDLEAAYLLIEELPNAGEPVPHGTIPNLRRVLLGLSQHYLYDSVNTSERVVEILALWHTSRGECPRL